MDLSTDKTSLLARWLACKRQASRGDNMEANSGRLVSASSAGIVYSLKEIGGKGTSLISVTLLCLHLSPSICLSGRPAGCLHPPVSQCQDSADASNWQDRFCSCHRRCDSSQVGWFARRGPELTQATSLSICVLANRDTARSGLISEPAGSCCCGSARICSDLLGSDRCAAAAATTAGKPLNRRDCQPGPADYRD